jgi:hypothetical protein
METSWCTILYALQVCGAIDVFSNVDCGGDFDASISITSRILDQFIAQAFSAPLSSSKFLSQPIERACSSSAINHMVISGNVTEHL